MKKIAIKIKFTLIITCLIFSGCENKEGSTIEAPEPIAENDEAVYENDQAEGEKFNEVIEDNSEIAELITYDCFSSKDGYGKYSSNSSIYISGLKIFEEFSTEEFGYKNEGSVNINSDENMLSFYITTFTGPALAAGSLPGPDVYFSMSLETNEIIEKRFERAPNYAEQAELSPEHINPESVKHSEKVIELSEKVIELSDERLSEIGTYFKEYIMEIEKNRKEKQV